MKRTIEQIRTDALAGFAQHAASLKLNGSFLNLRFTLKAKNGEDESYVVLGLNRRIRQTPVVCLNEATNKVRNFAIDEQKIVTPEGLVE
jgi:hypothetical protein